MYNLELKQLHADNAVTEALRAVETICDEYRLEEQFGILSLPITELLTQILATSENGDPELDITFFVENRLLTVKIQSDQPMLVVEKQLYTTLSADMENPYYTISRLADQIAFHDEAHAVTIEFHVNPQSAIPTEERAEILIGQQELVYKQLEE